MNLFRSLLNNSWVSIDGGALLFSVVYEGKKQNKMENEISSPNLGPNVSFPSHSPTTPYMQAYIPRAKATNGRREDYVRLPFVDDLCLRSAMQDFLRRKPSSQAKLTRRQTKLSKCQRCQARISSPAT